MTAHPSEPQWLNAARAAAKERFAALPDPSFRYGLDIRMDPISLESFSHSAPTARLLPAVPKGVELLELRAALTNDSLRDHFLTLLPPIDKFSAWHALHATDGFVLRIPAGLAVTEPIVLPHVSDKAVAADHLLIIAGENSSATVVQTVSATGQPQYRSLATEAFLAPAARLTIASVQTLPGPIGSHSAVGQAVPGPFTFVANRAHLSQDASLEWSTGDLGGSATLSEMTVTLAGRGSSLRTNQALFGSGTQAFNTSLNVIHAAPDTSCDLQSRGALSGKSKAIYRGLIKMRSNALRASGTQRADVLLLSPEAEADPVPALEIDTNDVKCSHATAVGKIDPEKLFYLMSRGLSPEEAARTVVRGFFSPLLHNVGPCKAQLAELLESRIMEAV